MTARNPIDDRSPEIVGSLAGLSPDSASTAFTRSMTRSMSNDRDGVWAMRSLRARRSGLLRTEPKGVSALREPAAIALFWLLLFGLAVVL